MFGNIQFLTLLVVLGGFGVALLAMVVVFLEHRRPPTRYDEAA